MAHPACNTESRRPSPRFARRLAVDSPRQALRSHVAADRFIHFDENEPPVAAIGFVLRQHRMAGCPTAGEGIKNQRIFVAPNF